MPRNGRTSIKGKHAVPKKHVKSKETFEKKHAVVLCLNQYGINRVRWDFYPHLNEAGWITKTVSIYRWGRNSEKIAEAAANVTTARLTRLRPKGTATVLTEDTERRIVKWINELRGDGVPISGPLLSIQAVEESRAQGLAEGQFVASATWQQSFLDRHRLSFRSRTRVGQVAAADSVGVAVQFAAEVKALMDQHGITRVYNADQTAIYYEMLPKKTVDQRGVRTVWVKCGRKEKERATAMLLADSDGNKYPVFLVFKSSPAKTAAMRAENTEKRHGFGKPTWEQIKEIQRANGVQVYGNRAAWWNADITISWLRFHFGDRSSASPPILLLLDAFSGHWTSDVKAAAASMNVILKEVPKCQTWQCQPADVAWIKPIKDMLRRKWVEYLREKLLLRVPGVRFVLTPPTRVEVGAWVAAAWDKLSPRIVINGFVKCGLPVAAPTTASDPVPVVEEIDTTELVETLEAIGEVDTRVGAVSSSADVIDAVDAVDDVAV